MRRTFTAAIRRLAGIQRLRRSAANRGPHAPFARPGCVHPAARPLTSTRRVALARSVTTNPSSLRSPVPRVWRGVCIARRSRPAFWQFGIRTGARRFSSSARALGVQARPSRTRTSACLILVPYLDAAAPAGVRSMENCLPKFGASAGSACRRRPAASACAAAWNAVRSFPASSVRSCASVASAAAILTATSAGLAAAIAAGRLHRSWLEHRRAFRPSWTVLHRMRRWRVCRCRHPPHPRCGLTSCVHRGRDDCRLSDAMAGPSSNGDLAAEGLARRTRTCCPGHGRVMVGVK